ncbi:MAG: NYN domain-containing protein [archaeon]|nr:NYN domain-containing protein [archaeon]
MKKAIFFFDANNWYHNVKRSYNPSEIDPLKLVKFFCEVKHYELIEIRWYASVPSISDGENMYYNHMSYLESLEKKGVKVIIRKLQKFSNKEILKRKQQTINDLDLCDSCKKLVEANFLDLADIKRKEKGVDVGLAVDMIELAVIENKCEVCVLISGDADFIPALNILKSRDKEVLTAMTPKGYSKELIDKFPYFILRNETLMRFFKDYPGRQIK